jgi:D-glycero-beta-D-manno-heptose-7-phosphate kinase
MSGKIREQIKSQFPKQRVVVVGDLVADQFLSGTIRRISREAPVFIVDHDETETRPGGAANAAANLASLGAQALAIGVVGDDSAGDELLAALASSGVATDLLIREKNYRTPTKLRVLAGQQYAPRQQVIRIDHAPKEPVPRPTIDKIVENLEQASASAGAVILSDYNYGTVTPEVYSAAKTLCEKHGIPLVVDSRFGLRKYPGATAATPNKEEAEAAIGGEIDNERCDELRKELGYEALLVTLGNRGMLLLENGQPAHHIPAVGSLQPVDVTGAGDTVIAAYALGLASGMTHRDAAAAANRAGGIVVMKRGTAVIAFDELLGSFTDEAEVSAIAAPEN